MSTDSITQALTAVGGLALGVLGVTFGLVKWLVPRIDAGYKAALGIQEKHQGTMAAHLARLAESTSDIAHTHSEMAKVLERLVGRSLDHHQSTEVHRAVVDVALGLRSGGLANEGPSARSP